MKSEIILGEYGSGGGHFAKAPVTGVTLTTSFQTVTTNDVTTNQPFTPKTVVLAVDAHNSNTAQLSLGYISSDNSSWVANAALDGNYNEVSNDYMEITTNGFKIKAPNSAWTHKAYWVAWD